MRIRAALILACAAALGAAPTALAAPKPADFQVGAAVESVAPPAGVDVYDGGFGASPPIHIVDSESPVQVRAIYISNGKHSVAIATLDAQAYFSAYQEDATLGITGVRDAASQEISGDAGVPDMTSSDIIVQSTHTHAGATLEGIWGPVPPAYLKLVHDQTIKAIVEAERRAKAANVEMGTYDAPWLDNIDNNQTDSYPGWPQDGQVSVLRAVTPDGEPIATFTSVPAHGDIVEGSEEKILNADYFGYTRAALDDRLGGINIVGPATLGREETPVQVGGIPVAKWFSGVVTSIVGRAIADAHWITDDTVASANTFTQVPGTNPALLALVAANQLPDDEKQQMWHAASDSPAEQSLYPIDRSIEPPYLTGSAIGTDLTALRIGGNVFLSMPGEPFPEVRAAIAQATTGADTIVGLSKGQDDWGYFYPAWVAPFAAGFFAGNGSDHTLYNIAPQAGDQVILNQTQNIAALGFATEKAAISPPLVGNRYEAVTRAGLQAMAAPTWGDAAADTGTLNVAFTAVWDDPVIPSSSRDGAVHVDFGDGTSQNVNPDKRTRFFHAYTPGRYTVMLTGKDTSGNVVTWQLVVNVYPPLAPSYEKHGDEFAAHVDGGDGSALSYEWTFDDGTVLHGPVVTHDGTDQVTLRVVDGTTTVATTG